MPLRHRRALITVSRRRSDSADVPLPGSVDTPIRNRSKKRSIDPAAIFLDGLGTIRPNALLPLCLSSHTREWPFDSNGRRLPPKIVFMQKIGNARGRQRQKASATGPRAGMAQPCQLHRTPSSLAISIRHIRPRSNRGRSDPQVSRFPLIVAHSRSMIAKRGHRTEITFRTMSI
jgi:hypothetical protein